jgi:ligand-binding sensor domain-containing protein
MKKIHVLFLLFILFVNSVTAQSSLRFGRISVDKGLSQSTVYCTYQDSQGFIWVGTEDGLNKYDGYTFDIYKFDPTDTSTISNNIVQMYL